MAIHICKKRKPGDELEGELYRQLTNIPGGDRFTDRQQQDLLVQVLVQTDAVHGWPTHALQRQLRDTWGIP
jgi:hypothetical protein